MIGLEDRLRSLEGVASIRVELGPDGVDAIKVEVLPDIDEAGVLEEIRQVLVSYGLRSRKPGWRLGFKRVSPAIIAEVASDESQQSLPDLYELGDLGLPQIGDANLTESPSRFEVSLGVTPPIPGGAHLNGAPAKRHEASADLPGVTVKQGGLGLVITIFGGGREVEATSDVSPIGAAEAMAKVAADFHGLARPDRVSVVMHELDGERVVTLMMRRGAASALTVEVARPMLHDALYLATVRALRKLEA